MMCDLMASVVGDGDVAVGRNHQLVESLGSQGGFEGVCHGPGGDDVRLDGVRAGEAALHLLVLHNHEGTTELVKSETHLLLRHGDTFFVYSPLVEVNQAI